MNSKRYLLHDLEAGRWTKDAFAEHPSPSLVNENRRIIKNHTLLPKFLKVFEMIGGAQAFRLP